MAIVKKNELSHKYDHTMDNDHHSQKTRTTTTSIAVIAIVAALGLLGVVAVTIVTIPLQQAEAGCERGGAPSTAVNASKGRCFRP
jgi:hypothetical protein